MLGGRIIRGAMDSATKEVLLNLLTEPSPDNR